MNTNHVNSGYRILVPEDTSSWGTLSSNPEDNGVNRVSDSDVFEVSGVNHVSVSEVLELINGLKPHPEKKNRKMDELGEQLSRNWPTQALRRGPVVRIVDQFSDIDAHQLINESKSKHLQRELFYRMKAIDDKGIELTQRIRQIDPFKVKDLGELLSSIEALPQSQRQAPLKALLTYCAERHHLMYSRRADGSIRPESDIHPVAPAEILLRLAVLVATSPVDRCDEFLPLLAELARELPKMSHDMAYPKFVQRMPHPTGDGADKHAPSYWRVLTALTNWDQKPDMRAYLEEPVYTKLLTALCQEGEWPLIDKKQWLKILEFTFYYSRDIEGYQRYQVLRQAFHDFQQKGFDSAHEEAMQLLGSTPVHQWVEKVDLVKHLLGPMGRDHCLTFFCLMAKAACHSDNPDHQLTRFLDAFKRTAPAEHQLVNLVVYSMTKKDALTTEKLLDAHLAIQIQKARRDRLTDSDWEDLILDLRTLPLNLSEVGERHGRPASEIQALSDKVTKVTDAIKSENRFNQ
jgi:hypothetical protein